MKGVLFIDLWVVLIPAIISLALFFFFFLLMEEACKHVNRGTFVKVEIRVINLVVL